MEVMFSFTAFTLAFSIYPVYVNDHVIKILVSFNNMFFWLVQFCTETVLGWCDCSSLVIFKVNFCDSELQFYNLNI